MKNWLYDFLKPLVRAYYFLVWGVRAAGAENVSAPGGYVLCSNHVHARDPFVLATCVRRRLRFMAKAELFKNHIVGGFISAIGAFPIRRGESDLGAVRESIKILNDGHVLGIFPQGTRSRENQHTHMEPGVALIALRAGAKVVPAYIDGPYRLSAARAWFLARLSPLTTWAAALTAPPSTPLPRALRKRSGR